MAYQSFKKFFSETVNESFKNALPSDVDLKNKYKDQVWNLLQDSYKSIGGIKGSGFNSVDDMLNIPMWKMNIINGKVVAVVMYKDKGGRKLVAIGTDGSDKAKSILDGVMKQEVGRSFMELSKGALGSFLKKTPENIVHMYAKTPEEADKLLPKDEILYVKDLDDSEIPSDGKLSLSKYPYIKQYAYIRDIGGEPYFKVMFGTEGKTIK